jgi:hypothetical protein
MLKKERKKPKKKKRKRDKAKEDARKKNEGQKKCVYDAIDSMRVKLFCFFL